MTLYWYSDLLHLHAAKWGLEVPEPRPLIDDDTSPYPRATIIEKIMLPGDTNYRYTEIALVTLNDQYSYTLNYQWRTAAVATCHFSNSATRTQLRPTPSPRQSLT